MKKTFKWKVSALLLASFFLLASCGSDEKTEEEIKREEIIASNLKNTPEIDEYTKELIKDSYGTPVEMTKEEESQKQAVQKGDESSIPLPPDSFNPGPAMAEALGSYSKEELIKQDALIHFMIFVNGVLRDEYRVAANALYGPDQVQKFKEEFKNAMLSSMKTKDVEHKVIDVLGVDTALKDEDVARHHVDDVIQQLNRSYIQVAIGDDFGEKMTISARTFGVDMKTQLENVVAEASNFIVIPEKFSRTRLSEEQLKNLNAYYVDVFGDALKQAKRKEKATVNTLAGFERTEEGIWIPSQMSKLAENILRLIYL